ncbi:DNA-processing protein DprA [Piscinibacter sp.]|uniref:DNA-processing protein DprA n=1 Tax=Piscinibacter sp. TaxID=1903157 RepID=UPI0039E48AA4
MDADELAAWLRLIETPGVGRATARRLLAAHGSPQAAARRASPEAPEHLAALVDTTQAWLARDAAHHVVALGDADYPRALLESPDPPLLLYAAGRLELLNAPALAIVGSRHASAQGRENARAFAAHLGAGGLAIVSGLALGIDAAAHEGALGTRGGTIAVVGTGLDQVYPRRHAALAGRIAAEGLIVGEFALGTPPLPENFPRRNRIIAALARGTLVVEATLQSGSLITARLAADAGREVFAIPGSIHAPQSKGCHALLKQGAKLVETAQDVLEELGTPAPAEAAPVEAPIEAPDKPDPLLDAMGHDPIGLDELIARTGTGAAELSARLLELELAGRVERLPGQRFQRIARA